MDRQSVFNTVAKHLLTQNRAAIDAQGRCYYRSPEGLKCAVGCLIPDDLYDPGMESKNAITLCERYTLVAERIGVSFSSGDHEFLMELQRIHDGADPVVWRDELARVAFRCGLEMPS